MSDKVFEIYNQDSGHSIGFYTAADGDAALEAMARDAGYADLAEMWLDTGVANLVTVEAIACTECQTRGELRECYQCGVTATVVDCGHQPQPAVISAGRDDGSDLDHWYCGDCARAANDDGLRCLRSEYCYGCSAPLTARADGSYPSFCGHCAGER